MIRPNAFFKSGLLVLAGSLALSLRAAAPTIINYQGKLTNKDGNPASGTSGRLTFAVSLYDNAGGTGQPLFGESHVNVPVANGVFNLPIGGGTSQTSTLLSAVQGRTDVWLQIAVGGDVLLPRQRLAASPYALSVAANSVGGAELQENITLAKNLNIQSNALFVDRANRRVGLGTGLPIGALDVAGTAGGKELLVGHSSGHVFLNARANAHLVANGWWDGTNWNRFDTAKGAGMWWAGSDGSLQVLQGNAGANPLTFVRAPLFINTLGYVGIGTTNPRNDMGWPGALEVAGQVRAAKFYDDDANYWADLNGGGRVAGNWQFLNGESNVNMHTGNAVMNITGSAMGQCCNPYYPTLSLAEDTARTGRTPFIQFHNAGQAEAYIRFIQYAGYNRRFEMASFQAPVDLAVSGNIYGAAKFFQIPHPLKKDMKLIHSSLEGPEIGVYYRGQAQLSGGRASVALPDYFEALTLEEGRTVLLTPFFDSEQEPVSALAASQVKNGRFSVKSIDGNNDRQRFYWEVKAVRKDLPKLEVERP